MMLNQNSEITKNLAIVVPCFNEEEMLEPQENNELGLFLAEFNKLSFNESINLSFVFVDDGSRDKTLYHLRRLSNIDNRVHYVSFSRNFGKESALYAGLENALALNPSADYIVTMDVDLQDPPSLLPNMLDICLSNEYDTVATRRVTRKGEPIIRSFFARMFYRIINKISSTEIVDGARDFRMMPRKMVEALIAMPEVNRFSKGLFSWVGFKTKWLEYENINRKAGETKWSFWKLFKYSIDGIASFSTTPLYISSFVGIITCLAAFIYLIVVLVKTLAFGEVVKGYPSLMCVILFFSGVMLTCVGILGLYLSKMYIEVKRRPIYVIKESK